MKLTQKRKLKKTKQNKTNKRITKGSHQLICMHTTSYSLYFGFFLCVSIISSFNYQYQRGNKNKNKMTKYMQYLLSRNDKTQKTKSKKRKKNNNVTSKIKSISIYQMKSVWNKNKKKII